MNPSKSLWQMTTLIQNYQSYRMHRLFVTLVISVVCCVCVIYLCQLSLITPIQPSTNDISIISVSTVSTISSLSSTESDDYLIYTDYCHIPVYKLFDEQTKPLYRQLPSIRCNKLSPDTVWLSKRIRRYNATSIILPNGKDVPTTLQCEALELMRDSAKESVKYGKTFKKLNLSEVHNFPQMDAIEIKCRYFKSDNNRNVTFNKVIALIPYRRPKLANPFKVFDNDVDAGSYNHSIGGILLLGIDSLSRLNFHRHMGLTKSLLEQYEFVPLLGHHKVGDNTWPNLLAILSGESIDHYTLKQWLVNKDRLDRLPWIFRAYSRAGWLTTYIEDMADFGFFTYYKKQGFIEPPMDYFMRPLSVKLTDELNNGFCYQNKLEIEFYYDYIRDQIKTFRDRRQRFLIVSHMASLTHNRLNNAQFVDKPLTKLLRNIFNSKLNENLVILLYSDHGIRFGPIMKTKFGIHETSMPMAYVYVPKSIAVLHQTGQWLYHDEVQQYLRLNAQRLTSQYDFHATLKHLLYGIPPVDQLYGESLLSNSIQFNRTCDEAGIPKQYCQCISRVPFHNEKITTTLAERVVSEINVRLMPVKNVCANLSLHTVIESTIQYDDIRNDALVSVKIQTTPNNATFEATFECKLEKRVVSQSVVGTADTMIEELVMYPNDEQKAKMLNEIQRYDRYREQSLCVANSVLERFCYCNTLL